VHKDPPRLGGRNHWKEYSSEISTPKATLIGPRLMCSDPIAQTKSNIFSEVTGATSLLDGVVVSLENSGHESGHPGATRVDPEVWLQVPAGVCSNVRSYPVAL
jgi:hypothetical protein